VDLLVISFRGIDVLLTKPIVRYCRLLRASRQRPRRRHAAAQRDEGRAVLVV